MGKILSIITIILILAGGWYLYDSQITGTSESEVPFSVDALNATYLIGGKLYTLIGGRSEEEIAPESATKTITSVFGESVYGDLDEDGDDDVGVMLVQDSGGSGTFYYVAVSVNEYGQYRGTNAILLGDRIAPQNVNIKNGILIANYADRKSGEAMTASPSVGKSKYMTLEQGEIREIKSLSEGEQVLEGYITIGHEVRSFQICGDGIPEYWLQGDSPALDTLMEIYASSKVLPGAKPYIPLFAVLAGRVVEAPKDGFGADYEYAFVVSQVVKTSVTGNCKSDLIVVRSPLPGSVITSPLTVEGLARGPWYFEGGFPIILTDWDGKIIAESYASSQSEWMTEDLVSFKGLVEFDNPEPVNGFSDRGILIFKKDNPSGLPEYDDAFEVPVYFR